MNEAHQPTLEQDGAPSFQDCFDALLTYTIVVDRDLKVLRANRRFVRDFGEVVGRFCYEACKGSAEPCGDCVVRRTFEQDRELLYDDTIRTVDDRLIPVIARTSPIHDENGQVGSVLASFIDMQDLAPLRHRLKESHERYRLLFDAVPCYITVQNRDLDIVDANERFVEAFGPPQGRKCYEIYKHRNEECIPCAVQETFKDGYLHHSEEVVTSVSGKHFNTLVYSAPIRDREGNIESVMEMSADITPIRELQSQLEGIGLLISSVSHSVKGLLNGLDGGMYLLNTGFEKSNPKRQKQGLEMVQRNVDRIRSMVLNILYYARERTPQWETVSPLDVGQEAINILETKAAELAVSLEPDFDMSCGDLEADPQALRSMLINLLENSFDACRVDENKQEHRVSFRIRKSGDEVCFEIEDNGIGMDRETREKAFSVFFTSKGVKGTGLGLFIADKITRSHGGRIDLESTPGQGTRITIRLPKSRPAEDTPTPMPRDDS